MNVLTPFDRHGDIWRFSSKSDLSDYTFYFDFFPNDWFKQTFKQYVKDCVEMQKPKVQTLNRYNYSIRHFFDFILTSNLELRTFEDLSPDIVEMFVFYLLHTVESSSTRSVIFSALKHLIRHGQRFEWSGFPSRELFDGTEFRSLKTEDVLKSMIIPDIVMEQIRATLLSPSTQNSKDVLIRNLVRICMDTGIRISEVLMIHEDSILYDLIGKPLLEVISEKNETERFIAVSKEVVEAVNAVKTHTEEIRKKLGTKQLFVYSMENSKRETYLQQTRARHWLKWFVRNYNITGPDGNLFSLTFHQFRHTLGTDMLNRGMSPYEVQDYLGHESLHSTALYAKVRDDRVLREYKKLGFVGLITDKVENAVNIQTARLDLGTRQSAALPDGMCRKPINGEGNLCRNFNMCLFCEKFITTPEYLSVHQQHLERIRTDSVRYMADNFVGTTYHLKMVENSLIKVIEMLEELVGHA